MLYRPSVIRKRPDGRRRREKTAVWWGRYVDPATGRKVSVSLQTADKAAARIAFARIERDAQTGAANPFAAHEKRPLTEHVQDWRDVLAARGNTSGHVDRSCVRVSRVFKACGFKTWRDVVASRVQTCLAAMKDADPRKGRGRRPTGRLLSAQTRNHYTRALKGFFRWLVLDRRAALNPLAHLAMENVRTDRRHDRRALTVAELRRLLETTANGPERLGMSGAARAMFYRLAVQSGLRLGELASLTWSGLDLDASTPTVTIAAAYAKNRRADTLPLKARTAAMLAAWRDARPDLDPNDPVFALPHRDNVLRAMRLDLQAANIEYVDADGRFADVHSLRHTFISHLAHGGVSPKLAMDLARHSDVRLTLGYYSHTLLPERAAALDALPDLDADRMDKSDVA